MSIKKTKKIVLVAGPPSNGRDEYVLKTLPKLKTTRKVGYYHIFEYMQEMAGSCGIKNLKRENVFDISQEKLKEIRNKAFSAVIEKIQKSKNDIDIISTPAVFKVPPRKDYFAGEVEGINLKIIRKLKPNVVIAFIDDLVRVRDRIGRDPLTKKLNLELKDLAEWRESSIQILKDYVSVARSRSSIDFVIFAAEHPINTFIDFVLGEKPRLYLSYHITGQQGFKDIRRLIRKLSTNFVCMDPYAIKDWLIVKAFDQAIEKGNKVVRFGLSYSNHTKFACKIPLQEAEDAIDLIRSQIVERDLELIANVHATVVYHKATTPSYGVMVEVFHSATTVQRPVYVLYPFKIRLSPFFEHFIKRENIIQGTGSIKKLEDKLVAKLIKEYPSWQTWSSS